MADFVTLTCPSCGGKLEITKDIDRFACAHCGNEQIVKRSGGIVALQPVVAELRDLKGGIDRTGSELAITRIQKEFDELNEEINNQKSEVDQLNKEVKAVSLAPLVLFIIGFISLVGVLLGGDSQSTNNPILVCCGSLGLIFIIGGFVANREDNKTKKSKRQRIKNLEETINDQYYRIEEKEKELSKHKDIVSS